MNSILVGDMKKLAEYRRQKGMTQDDLATCSGVTSRTIQRIESGAVAPQAQTLKLLAACLGVELSDIAEWRADTDTDTAPAKPGVLALFHVLPLAGMFWVVPNTFIALVCWLLKRDESAEFDRQGAQVLNFQLTMTLAMCVWVVMMIAWTPMAFPLTFVTYGFNAAFSLINMFRVLNNKSTRYPFLIRFVRPHVRG